MFSEIQIFFIQSLLCCGLHTGLVVCFLLIFLCRFLCCLCPAFSASMGSSESASPTSSVSNYPQHYETDSGHASIGSSNFDSRSTSSIGSANSPPSSRRPYHPPHPGEFSSKGRQLKIIVTAQELKFVNPCIFLWYTIISEFSTRTFSL